MIHLGDITKVSGFEVPPVDVIIGGSPCQNLSVAGNRAGLHGEQSKLFYEQIRIVREMRECGERPRYMVWENVPGALSSNKGKDFAAVLNGIIRVAEPQAPPITVPENGWSAWGGFRDLDRRWSVAWRVQDAQYFGVPQRRRRIVLIADFGGATAHEILFESASLPRDFKSANEDESRASRSGGLGSNSNVVYDMSHAVDVLRWYDGIVPTLQARMGTGGNQVPLVIQNRYLRRLTPLECERLQGLPDGWTDIGDWVDSKGRIRKSSDSLRYKAIGNSIAVPMWKTVLRRLASYLGEGATLGSLFDGIGAFPYIWEQIEGKSSCLWASEIEEFPIAVSKYHFGDT